MRIAVFTAALASIATVNGVTIQNRFNQFPTIDYEELNLAEVVTTVEYADYVPVPADYFGEIGADAEGGDDDEDFTEDVMATNMSTKAPTGTDKTSIAEAKKYALEKAQEDALFLMSKKLKAKKKGSELASTFFTAIKGGLDWFYKFIRTQAYNRYMKIARNLKKQKAFLTALVTTPKLLTRKDFLGFFKRIPVLGGVVKGILAVGNIVKKAVLGDDEACYRSKIILRTKVHGMSLNKKTIDKCVAPLEQADGKCYFPCPSNMEPHGFMCV